MITALKHNENIMHKSTLHGINYVAPIIVALAGTLWSYAAMTVGGSTFSIGVGVVLLSYAIYSILNIHSYSMYVTNLRVIIEHGVISKNCKEMPIEKLQNVSYSVSLLGSLLGYGKLTIDSAATKGEIKLTVEKPKLLKEQVSNSFQRRNSFDNTLFGDEPTRKSDIYEELEKLDTLRNKGIITEDEFSDSKRRLLAKV